MGSMNEFYSVVLRKKITIPTKNIRKKKSKNGRDMLVGTYTFKGKQYNAYKFI